MRSSSHTWFIPWLAAPVLLSACGSATPSPAVDTPRTTTVAPTQSAPTATPSPSRTATLTPTVTVQATPTPTAGPNFQEASVYAMAHLPSDRLLITIQVPGGIEGIYDAFIGDQLYPCEVLSDHPDRLYCVGPEPYVNYSPEGTLVRVQPLYPGEGATPVFEATFTVPARPTPTITLTPFPFLTPPVPLP